MAIACGEETEGGGVITMYGGSPPPEWPPVEIAPVQPIVVFPQPSPLPIRYEPTELEPRADVVKGLTKLMPRLKDALRAERVQLDPDEVLAMVWLEGLSVKR